VRVGEEGDRSSLLGRAVTTKFQYTEVGGLDGEGGRFKGKRGKVCLYTAIR